MKINKVEFVLLKFCWGKYFLYLFICIYWFLIENDFVVIYVKIKWIDRFKFNFV